MSVQTLDALAGTADAAGRPRSDMICWNGCVSFGLVGGVRASDVDRIKIGFRLADAPDSFDTAHRPNEVRTDEVVAGRHRGAITEERRIANDNRVALCSADNDIEGASRWAPDQLLDTRSVVH